MDRALLLRKQDATASLSTRMRCLGGVLKSMSAVIAKVLSNTAFLSVNEVHSLVPTCCRKTVILIDLYLMWIFVKSHSKIFWGILLFLMVVFELFLDMWTMSHRYVFHLASQVMKLNFIQILKMSFPIIVIVVLYTQVEITKSTDHVRNLSTKTCSRVDNSLAWSICW